MNNSEIRQKIFDRYSNNFKEICDSPNWTLTIERNGKIEPINGLFYICPICLGIFNSESLNQKSVNPLTLEHVPIASLGGKVAILTCKQCNNESGKDLDKHLKIGSDLSYYIKGKGKIPIKLRIEGNNPYKSEMTFDPNQHKFSFNHPKDHPYADEQILKLKNNWEGVEIKFDIKGPSKKKFNVALLKTAYLLAFKHFGYSYLFSEGAKIIRSQFMNPTNDIIEKPLFIKNEPSIRDYKGINLITEPKDLKSILAVFTLQQKEHIDSYGVLLPGPYEDHVELYLNHKRQKGKVDFKFVQINEDKFMDDVNLYFKLW